MYRQSVQRFNVFVLVLFLFLSLCNGQEESVCPAEFGQCQSDSAKGNAMLQNKKLVTNTVSGVEENSDLNSQLPSNEAAVDDDIDVAPAAKARVHFLDPSHHTKQPAIALFNAVSQGTPAAHAISSENIPESAAEKLRQTILDIMAAAKASNVTVPPVALAVLAKIDAGTDLTNADVLDVEDAAAAVPEFDDDNSAEAAKLNRALTTAGDFANWSGVKGEDVGPNGSVPSYQGDMIPASAEQLSLWQHQESLLEEEAKEDLHDDGEHRRRRRRRRRFAGSLSAGAVWTEGKVKYCYASNIDARVKHVFEAAIHQFNHVQRKCLVFEDVGLKRGTSESSADMQECSQSPAIFVMSKNAGCYSYVGMVASMKSQQLNLAPNGCISLGIAIHELGHALGMAHEHSRPDRDQYVTVHMDRVQAGNTHNFDTVAGTFAGDRYDFLSIMHYDAHAFSTSSAATITQNDQSVEFEIGQRTGLSKYDAKHIEHMYSPIMSKCESARGLQEEMGCLDRPADNGQDICTGITQCTAGTVEKCCACGGGFKIQCYKGRHCAKVAALPPPSGSACILDQTAAYGHQYPCVFTNACSYTIKIVSESGCTYNIAAGGPRVQQCDGKVDANICQNKCTVTKA
eukprot:gnl/MRDRNA2_/MRDRNA2_101234_c0_seq1.p1 gnl/MRDRNA2_/MRDRNA2_101234_c0~~gnl/MRDRNA2_/MRDRNA2_101234_c0_seq1.p1  ORF type:complete len:627 (+),score=105.11 gnl/MRDRNA2_/MRDRNA2_101234_c0_seq1:101-1981(+)